MARSQHSRRDFLKKSFTVAAAGSTIPYFAWSQPAFANAAANDRPRLGCIGLGDQGSGDALQHAVFADIVAVCDVDALHAERAKHTVGKGKAKCYGDYRKVLDRPDIDVVSIVTPDHWHVKIAIEALQAGKNVFCQKPLTLTLEEGQLIRAACKKSKQLFMVGTQQRSIRNQMLRAVNMVQKGILGDIQRITVGIDAGHTGGPFPKLAPPKELDWNFWLGQAPKVEYIEKRCHRNFRWWYEYSGGKFTDWGAHHVDIATWAIQQDKEGMGPSEIDGADAKHASPLKDGYPTVDDCYNTAYDFAVKCKFPGGIQMIVTNRRDNGILFEGTKGRIFVNRDKITGKPIEEQWDKGKFGPGDLVRFYKGKTFESHKRNFYRCLREGGLPVSDVFSHVQAINTCHLCAIAARLGRVIHWDPKAEKITGDDQAAAFFARQQRPGFEIPKI
jgi:predicted dehydrogenase